jgi:hypothetical protein
VGLNSLKSLNLTNVYPNNNNNNNKNNKNNKVKSKPLELRSRVKKYFGRKLSVEKVSQGGYTYTIAKPVFRLLIFPFLTLVRTP